MEKQLIEVIGRSKFTEFAILSGFELATPVRDCGIDCLLYFPIEDGLLNTAVPVQLKCYSSQALTVDSKYNRIGDILHVILWNCLGVNPKYFALTQKHAMQLAVNFNWDKLPGWISKNGRYDATNASKPIVDEMMKYSVNTKTFKEIIRQYYNLKKTE
ncbi:MAG: hypothetical protein Q8O19_08165 [Rectinemataceae bacterium]|nr:hypothetical protein [Rectinemataceae bacterium]